MCLWLKKNSPKTFGPLSTHKAYTLITLSKLRSQLMSHTGFSYVVYQVRLKWTLIKQQSITMASQSCEY
jgi:hypothetical protein